MSTVLVVDDKEMLRDSVGVTLQRGGMRVLAAASGAQALELITSRKPDAVVTDLKMPGMTGIGLLESIRDFDDDLPVVLMTAYGDVETAVCAMRLGAYSYITKPFEGDELLIAVKRAMEHAKLKRDNALLRLGSAPGQPSSSSSGSAAGEPRGVSRLVGSSGVMAQLKDQVRAVACSSGTALLHGKSGVGKEVIARAIHEESPRSSEAFLAINCAALSPSLLESELFGHEKGAFTGAEKLRKGRFELAHGGTLLLDEVSEVSPQVQAKLLRVLQERVFERVGSSTPIGVDVRVVATTNRDLPAEVRAGRFRQDLYFRLNVLPVAAPPLRDRLEDVPELAAHFIERVCVREGRPVKRLTPAAASCLCAYSWPGNVRELQNICERAVVLSAGDAIDDGLLTLWLVEPAGPAVQPAQVQVQAHGALRAEPEVVVRPLVEPALGGAASGSVRAAVSAISGARDAVQGGGFDAIESPVRPLAELEREAIVHALRRFNGHRQRTATALGIGVRTLGLKLKKWKEEQLVSESL